MLKLGVPLQAQSSKNIRLFQLKNEFCFLLLHLRSFDQGTVTQLFLGG